MKTVFIHPERCVGCKGCEFACAVEHSRSRDAVLALSEHPLPRTGIHVRPGAECNSFFPNRCRHCNPAPCQDGCPTAAITRNAEYDVVLVDPDKCIACAMCAVMCPFDVITFHPWNGSGNDNPLSRVVATKCDGCVTSLEQGKMPACVDACHSNALIFGELNDLIEAEQIRQSVLATPDVRYRPRLPDTIAAWRGYCVRQ
uniref:Carbon-monoxide dehydrogenase iron sulfur subunit n=1 Tax=Candidatus Kentrum sp. FW TaxID=2126338 RepID=A0A450TSM4_9GAMM|nr:MAG: carbon-monoxide dehydrogenase iron sulfur subunit [Candidatus Kentron sp. FW]